MSVELIFKIKAIPERRLKQPSTGDSLVWKQRWPGAKVKFYVSLGWDRMTLTFPYCTLYVPISYGAHIFQILIDSHFM